MQLTRELAAFCADLRDEDVPEAALVFVRIGFADCVATLAAGRHDGVTRRLMQALAPAPGACSLLLGLGTAAPHDAVLVNATAAHALDFDDAAQRGHLSTVLVPAILAEAEVLGASGRRMATAYAAGYEVWAELLRREPDHYHNHAWHPTGVFGTIAVAAACARLRGLDAERTMHALAIAASGSGGLIANFGSMTKPFHAGRASQAGLMAARLAEIGFTGSPEALEHPKGLLRGISPKGRVDVEAALEAGRVWKLPRGGLNVKKYPTCFATHRALDGMLDLLEEQPLRVADVARVRVTTSRRNRATLRYADPADALQAKFSMQFAMAAALVAGRAGLTELEDSFLARDDVQATMRRVEVLPDDREDPARPGEAPEDVVEVETSDGALLRRRVDYVRGGPEKPLRQGELFGKFSSCLAAGGLRGDARPLFDALSTIDRQDGVAAIYRLLG
jgi:2-methylcitrate dehydratase PrpD